MRNLWIAVVALVGIGLALFLFQRPDTGDVSIDPDAARTGAATAPTVGAAAETDAIAEAKARRPRAGRKEGMERLMEIRSRPDAVYAGKLIGPWTAVRFTLMKEFADDPEATEISEAIKPLLQVMQQGRRDPTREAPLADTQSKLDALATQIRATDLINHEKIADALKRHDVTIDEFASAAANAAESGAAEEDSE